MGEHKRHDDVAEHYPGPERRRVRADVDEIEEDIGLIKRNWKGIAWFITAMVTFLSSYFATKNVLANLSVAVKNLETGSQEVKLTVIQHTTQFAVLDERMRNFEKKQDKADDKLDAILRAVK